MIKPVPSVVPVSLSAAPSAVSRQQSSETASFAKQLSDALAKVNEMQLTADEYATKLVLGEVEELHEVTVAMEQAKLSLQLAVQVRNKIVEAYQEIARMQV